MERERSATPKPRPGRAKPAPGREDGPMRLHRYLAQAGVTSRRKAEVLILEGRVEVNGEIVAELGTKVGPEDEVRVDGEVVRVLAAEVYVLNKPRGVVTTLSDERNRPTVRQLLPPSAHGIKPVGRLDMDTDGILVLTNDGELASRLTHPRYGVEKEYEAIVAGNPDDHALDRLARGVFIEGGRTSPADVAVVGLDRKSGNAKLRLVIHEGRKRQVRLMCEAVGHPVVSLRRTRFAHLKLKGMQPGECRRLGVVDVDKLRKAVGLS